MSSRELEGAARGERAIVEEDAEALYEEAPCGYVSTAPDGTILRVNRTFVRWTGHAGDDVVGRRRFQDLLPPGAQIYYETHYAPLLQMQGSVRELALEVVRADGSRLPALVNAALKRDPAGRPQVVRITVFDASERRRYERELLRARGEAEERAAAATALEHVAEGVVLLDEDGRIRLLNPAAERIFGVAAAEVRGLPLTTVAADWQSVGPRIPVGSADAPPAPVVVPLAAAGGTRWLAATGELAPEGTVYTLRDVTEERRLEDLRDDIVAVVSHELRTPLAGVHGAAQTLASLYERLDEAQRRQLVDVIAEGSGRLTRIVDRIVLADRLDRGDVVPERRSFDVGEAVERVLAAPDVARGRPLTTEIAAGVEAEGDPALVEQVLLELLDNAVKFSGDRTEVRVVVERSRASVRVVSPTPAPGSRRTRASGSSNGSSASTRSRRPAPRAAASGSPSPGSSSAGCAVASASCRPPGARRSSSTCRCPDDGRRQRASGEAGGCCGSTSSKREPAASAGS